MRAWQIRISTVGRVTLFPDEAIRRSAIRALVRVAGERLICFSVPDNHGHLIVLVSDGEARLLGRSVWLAWVPLAGVPLEEPWVRQFGSGAHLRKSVAYQLGQNLHHDLQAHAATWSGNCFADLVGARALDDLRCHERLREALPRFRLRDAHRAVGLPAEPLLPAGPEVVAGLGVQRLKDAAAAACCAPPELRGRSDVEVRSRRCVVLLGQEAGVDHNPRDFALIWLSGWLTFPQRTQPTG